MSLEVVGEETVVFYPKILALPVAATLTTSATLCATFALEFVVVGAIRHGVVVAYLLALGNITHGYQGHLALHTKVGIATMVNEIWWLSQGRRNKVEIPIDLNRVGLPSFLKSFQLLSINLAKRLLLLRRRMGRMAMGTIRPAHMATSSPFCTVSAANTLNPPVSGEGLIISFCDINEEETKPGGNGLVVSI